MDLLLAWFSFVAVFSAIPVTAALVVWWSRRKSRGMDRKPLEILREMRVRGQITPEIFERMRREFPESEQVREPPLPRR